MKATILLATLKKAGLSNTATLCEFLVDRMQKAGISCETVKLVDHVIPPGTYSNMGNGDEWEPSGLEGKVAGIIVTGDSDGSRTERAWTRSSRWRMLPLGRRSAPAPRDRRTE